MKWLQKKHEPLTNWIFQRHGGRWNWKTEPLHIPETWRVVKLKNWSFPRHGGRWNWKTEFSRDMEGGETEKLNYFERSEAEPTSISQNNSVFQVSSMSLENSVFQFFSFSVFQFRAILQSSWSSDVCILCFDLHFYCLKGHDTRGFEVRQLAQIYNIYASASALPACLSQIFDKNIPQANLTMKPTNQGYKSHETKTKQENPKKQKKQDCKTHETKKNKKQKKQDCKTHESSNLGTLGSDILFFYFFVFLVFLVFLARVTGIGPKCTNNTTIHQVSLLFGVWWIEHPNRKLWKPH